MGKPYATLKDVAKLAGTTAATVSYVLNGKEGRYISKEMEERVMKAVHELGYVKSSAASSLRGKKRGIIAVLVPQFANQFFTRMVLAVEAVADRKGYILSICNTFDNVERELDIINRMAQHRVDGYIMIPTFEGEKNTRQLRKLGVPMVVIDRPLEGVEDYVWVTTSNYRCGYAATEYLIQMGHRKIAFVGWNSRIPDLERRQQAFLDAFVDYGIPLDGAVIRNNAFSEENGYEMAQSVMEEHPEVTAMFFAYNMQAKGGIRYLTEHGFQIGEDISVILIGSPEWATVGANDYAHIEQHEYKLGEAAATILLDMIENPAAQHENVVRDCTLYKGKSVKNLNI